MAKVFRIIERLTHSPRGNSIKIHFKDKSACVDGGANKYTGKVQDDGFTSFIRMMKTTPGGADIGLDEVHAPMVGSLNPPTEMKIDSVALSISGSDLHIDYTAHDGDFNTVDCAEVWTGFVIPYGPEGPQLGKAGAYVGQAPTPDPNPAPSFTVEDIMVQMRREFGGDSNNIRQGLEDKAKDAIKELNLWSASIQARGFDRWLMDRVYQTFSDNVPGFWPWLRTKVPGATILFDKQQEEIRKNEEAAAKAAKEKK